ncbi:MAG: hypothetical protein WA624_18505 [Methylocella sp.]
MAKCHWGFTPFAASCHDRGERLGGDAGICDIALRLLQQGFEQHFRDRDGVAVKREGHRRHQRRLDLTNPERDRNGGRRQHVRRIEMAGHELVADIGPGGVSHEFNLDAPRRGEVLGFRHMEQCRVGQRHISDPQAFCHRNNSAAVMMERATSAIFLFSFIATWRMRA